MAKTKVGTASPPGVDFTFARDLANKMLDAWNAHDTDALLGLMAEDVVYDDSSWPKRMRGHADVREFLESTWRAIPDLTFEFEQVLINDDASEVANYWRATATQKGRWDPPGLDATGRRLSFEGTFLGELYDGKLRRIRVTHDVASIMRQLRILPDPGSRGERLIVELANLRTRLRGR